MTHFRASDLAVSATGPVKTFGAQRSVDENLTGQVAVIDHGRKVAEGTPTS